MLFDSVSLMEDPPNIDFWYRPYEVNKRFTHWAEVKGFPTYSVSAGTGGGQVTEASDHMHFERFPVSVKIVVQDNNDAETIKERALADVRKAIMRDACSEVPGSLATLCVTLDIKEPPDTDDGILAIEGGRGFTEQIFWAEVAGTYGET